MPVRVDGRSHDDAVISGRGVLLVELSRSGGRVDADIGMMDARVVRAELDART
jgi:hypothetical protein